MSTEKGRRVLESARNGVIEKYADQPLPLNPHQQPLDTRADAASFEY